jgi:hypothetical protein
VRVSTSNLVIATSPNVVATFGATEFNLGTPTDLGLDNTSISLPVGIWLATFELQFAGAASDWLWVTLNGPSNANIITMRSNATHVNDDGVGGTAHLSAPVIVTDPTTPTKCSVGLSPNNIATSYTITYMALSAIKISEYFV